MSTTTLTAPNYSISARANLTPGTLTSFGTSINFNPNPTLTAGNSGGQVDKAVAINFSVTSGTPYTFNVSTGNDNLNNALGAVHVTAVIVQNLSVTGGQDFTVGGGTHPVLGTDQFTVQANGGIGSAYNPNPGYTVTGASADTITIAVAAGTAVQGVLVVLGRDA